MLAVRSIVNTRSATLISALLLSTAFSVPAYAIETVVVTAEKKAEDIQTVPISVTAFGSKDLQAKQIASYKDLQFNMPSLTYANGFLGGANIAIRGIGSAAVSLTGDSGVAFNVNDIYTDESSSVSTDTYYDVERIEVLRGPQSTLYGRNATGGAFNMITVRPDLDNFMVSGDATYGNYDNRQIQGVVNVPIIDGKLGLRIAAFGELADGDRKNIYPGVVHFLIKDGSLKNVDSRDDYSGRASLRWQPTDDTTIDFIAEHSAEADTRQRVTIQGCVRDPSGVFGCLPTGVGLQAVNNNAVITNTFVSDIGLAGGTAFQLTQIGNTGPALSLGGLGQTLSTDFHKINADFEPYTQNFYNKLQLIVHQKLNDVLAFDLHGDYENDRRNSSESAYGTLGDSLAFDPANPVATAANHSTALQNGFVAACLQPATTQRIVAYQEILQCLAPADFANSGYAGHLGLLPISGPQNFGISLGNAPAFYSDHNASFDNQHAGGSQYSVEARIASSFAGPLNFLLAAYHLETRNFYNYEISSTALDLISTIAGVSGAPACAAFFGAGAGATYPCVLGPSNYNNINTATLSTSAVFGEVYYDIIPDELKFTGGFRLTSDNKTAFSQNAFINCFYNPLAFGGSKAALQAFISNSSPVTGCGAVGIPGTSVSTATNNAANFSAMTGRTVIDWTPKLDFTDQTLVYASYSRGYRAGGFNPAAQAGSIATFGITFLPETIDALEFGTKNTLFDGTLQANMDLWYYDYKNYQVSAIINKTAINANINAQLWGAEGEFLWAPDDHWTFGFNFSATDSEIGNNSFVDPRNPSQDAANTTVLKDYSGANCVIINKLGTGAPVPGVAGPGQFTNAMITSMLTPAAVSSIPGVAAGVAYINGSATNGIATAGISCSNLQGVLDLLSGGAANDHFTVTNGILKSIYKNKMPNTPPLGLGVNVQYVFDIFNGYTLVPRVDYYWKGADYINYFNAPEDHIKSWDETNAQIQLNAPDAMWYARMWVKNAFDKQNITGGGVGDQSQGLFNNLGAEPPRTFGLTLGAHL